MAWVELHMPEWVVSLRKSKPNADFKQQYSKGDRIGRGSFGRVYWIERCARSPTERPAVFAAKICDPGRADDWELLAIELHVHNKLSGHPDIITMVDAFIEPARSVTFVFELGLHDLRKHLCLFCSVRDFEIAYWMWGFQSKSQITTAPLTSTVAVVEVRSHPCQGWRGSITCGRFLALGAETALTSTTHTAEISGYEVKIMSQRLGWCFAVRPQLRNHAPRLEASKLHLVLRYYSPRFRLVSLDLEALGLRCIRDLGPSTGLGDVDPSTGLGDGSKFNNEAPVDAPNYVPLRIPRDPAEGILRTACGHLVGWHHLVRDVAK